MQRFPDQSGLANPVGASPRAGAGGRSPQRRGHSRENQPDPVPHGAHDKLVERTFREFVMSGMEADSEGSEARVVLFQID